MFGMDQIMKQAKQMQEQLKVAQEELAKRTFEATANGNAVRVVMTGHGKIVELTISEDFKQRESAQKIAEAVKAALTKAQDEAAKAAKKAMGPMGNQLKGLLG